MSIWIVLILSCAIFAAMGYGKGGVRMAASLLGILLGLLLAKSFSAPIGSMLAMAGVKNPIWNAIFAPITVVLISWIVFMSIGFAIHHKLYIKYKYSGDDVTRLRFDRMNGRVGLSLGLFAGVAVTFAICLLVYVVGYATVKLSNDTNATGMVGFINKVRRDIQASGFDKSMAALDASPARFYQAIDVLSLVYHNPNAQSRLTNYPPFLRILEQPEVVSVFTDTTYRDMLFGNGNAFQIAAHPTTVSLIKSPTLQEYYRTTDYNDFAQHIRTGKSDKFARTPIVGRWLLDPAAVVTEVRKKKPDMTASEIITLREFLEPLTNVQFVATTDNKVLMGMAEAIQGAPSVDPNASPDAAAQAEADAAAAAAAAFDRYGQPTQPQAPQQPRRPQRTEAPVALPALTGEGTWNGSGDLYTVTLPSQRGEPIKGTATIESSELIIETPEVRLTFYKDE